MKRPVGLEDLEGLHYSKDGLVPVVVQEETTGAVLMLAWANKEALARSLHTRRMTYWSRSRSRLWTKGEESGNTQHVVRLAADCDLDAILAIVRQVGPACHEDTTTCWQDGPGLAGILGALDAVVAARQIKPEGRYTDALLADSELATAKVREEADEVLACLRGEANDDSLAHEAADLVYHLLVALRGQGVAWQDVVEELRSRR